jgi:peptide/nickel transport system permease protein
MARWLAGRLLGVLLSMLLVATFTFFLTFALPTDVARQIVGDKGTPQDVALVRARLGLDDPLIVQYARYLGHLARGDFGYSYVNREPVSDILVQRIPHTAALALAAICTQLLIGIPLGLYSAARAGSIGDRAALGWAVIAISLPAFWVGLMLLYLFAFRIPIFPLGGADQPSSIVLPALTLGLAGAAWYSRVVRKVALETLNMDFVRALRAKGLPRRTILGKHVLRTSLSPVLTMMAIDFGFFLGGAVIVESVFAWPGLGLAAYQSMQTSDTPLLMGCVLFGSLFVLLLNLLADLARVLVDPRVRLR